MKQSGSRVLINKTEALGRTFSCYQRHVQVSALLRFHHASVDIFRPGIVSLHIVQPLNCQAFSFFNSRPLRAEVLSPNTPYDRVATPEISSNIQAIDVRVEAMPSS